MNKHEQIRKDLLFVGNQVAKVIENCPDELVNLEQYITEAKATEKELDYLTSTLKQFRNRWCEVKNAKELNDLCGYFINEVWKEKLSKVEEV